jgi:hypothetical protein
MAAAVRQLELVPRVARDKMVEILQEFVDMAKAGDVESFAVVVVAPGKRGDVLRAFGGEGSLVELVGAVEVVKARMLEKILGG